MVYTILDEDFQTQFGFTQQEIEMLLANYNLIHKAQEIQEWYNGYIFGKTIIYNPWSLLSCIANKGILEPYWVNTSDNELIKTLLAKAGTSLKDDFELLLSDKTVEKIIDKKIILPEIELDENIVWTLLLFAGYLTYTNSELREGYIHCHLTIPNKEIKFLYKDFLRYFFRISLKTATIEKLIFSIKSGDIATFSTLLQEFVINYMSIYDLPNNEPEKSYHLFVLGLLVLLVDEYEVRSNRESGYGRYDIMLIPKDKSNLGYVVEFKKIISDKETLEEAAQKVLEQIKAKKYAQELKALGIDNIQLLGIAFKGKELLVLEGN